MLIRHGQLTDLDNVYRIELANFGEGVAITREAFEERLQIMTDTFLVAEYDGQLVGYIEGPVVPEAALKDSLFHKVSQNAESGGYIAITSLSVSSEVKGQGVGTALIAAMKDLSIVQGREGLVLTCEDYLIPYYQMNGFKDEGPEDSQHGGKVWFRMVWQP